MIGFRQILVVLGVIFLIRMIGKIMTARRNINEQKVSQTKPNEAFRKEDIGKTTISKIDKTKLKTDDYTNYEEID